MKIPVVVDPVWYLNEYPDVALLGMEPAVHYEKYGRRLGRKPNSESSDSNAADVQRPVQAPRIFPPTGPRRPAVFISGEAVDRPGFFYRIKRWGDAFEANDQPVSTIHFSKIPDHLAAIGAAPFILIWRARFEDVASAISIAKEKNVPVIFDCDDLMIRPELATARYIDAIRYDKRDPAGVQAHYSSLVRTMAQASFCTATTHELAWHMRRQPPPRPVFVLPNGFDANAYAQSRVGIRLRPNDGLIRIGYASGSRTHQADFRQCSRAVASVLRANRNCRLVLFKRGTTVTLDLEEFTEFSGLHEQVEWRQMVDHQDLPLEVARFDINLAPLEPNNPFVAAKSELKFFEAAICDVPTVASPVGPYTRAIKPGAGLLAFSEEEWLQSLSRLIADPELRRSIAREAHRQAIAKYGPTRRARTAFNVLRQVGDKGRAAAVAFQDEARGDQNWPSPIPIAARKTVFEYSSREPSAVTVVIPLFNYEQFICEALDSVAAQTMRVDLVVVDDCSTDKSQTVALSWMGKNATKFNRAVLVQHEENSGLGTSRNTAFDTADSLYVMALDADNRLRPTCCQDLYDAIRKDAAAFAYPTIQQIGDGNGIMGSKTYSPASLIAGNWIDAMALISKEAWAMVGGYATHRRGWQDYDLWCRFISSGLHGVHVPKILAEYRVHATSMLRTGTNKQQNKAELVRIMEEQHPWLAIYEEREWYRIPRQQKL